MYMEKKQTNKKTQIKNAFSYHIVSLNSLLK